MLDIQTAPTAERVKNIRDGVEYTHKDPFDMSLYNNMAIFERVPIVAEIPVGIGQTMPVKHEGYSAVYNSASGQLVDMRPIADSYQLVPHQKMLATQASQLADSPLGGETVTVVDRIYEEGAKAHRTIYFDNLKADVKSRAGHDSVIPRLDVFNSINMAWAFQVFSGAYRDLCRNTLVFGGQKAYHQKRKHTRGLDVGSLTGKGVYSLGMFQGQREQMDLWARTGLSERAFVDILVGTICKKDKKASDFDKQPINKQLLNTLIDQYKIEARELGETMWAGYNALTHWSTHTLETKGARKTQKSHDTQRQRSDLVRDVIECDGWRYLEGAVA